MKNLKFLLMALALCVTFAFALSACNLTESEESNSESASESASASASASESASESESESEEEGYKVTFYFADLTGKTAEDLAAMLGPDGTFADKSLYTITVVKTTDGESVSGPAVTQLKKADVRGYERTWSTNDWRGDDIAENLNVYAKYTELEKVKVTFKNNNGSIIKVLNTYVGMKIEKNEYPMTEDWVYYYSATYLASLSGVDMSDYVVYAPKDASNNDILMDKNSKVTTDSTKAEAQYILAADVDKLDDCISLPFAWYFEAWDGVTTNLAADGTVTAQIKAADGVVKKSSSITVDGVKDAGYVEIGTLYPNIISNKRTGGKKGAYPLLAQYETEADINAAVTAGVATAADKEAWLNQKTEWEAQTKPVCNCGVEHDSLNATLYLAWDGDFVYVYAEVNDPHVVSHGKTYCQGKKNPYENDGVEIWYGIAGDFNKVALDAFGYQLYGGEVHQTSAYINECNFASKLMTASGPLAETVFNSWNGKIVTQSESAAAGVVGYSVEFAFAAYEEPVLGADEALEDDKSNWGTKLVTGDIFSLSLQLDDISEAASEDVVNRSIASEQTGAKSIDSLYKADGVANPNNRINLGVQASNIDQDGVLTLVLG